MELDYQPQNDSDNSEYIEEAEVDQNMLLLSTKKELSNSHPLPKKEQRVVVSYPSRRSSDDSNSPVESTRKRLSERNETKPLCRSEDPKKKASLENFKIELEAPENERVEEILEHA